MTQRDLNRAVARATGETVDVIAQMGFGPLDDSDDDSDGDPDGDFDEGLEPAMIDWDAHDDARLGMQSVRRRRLTAVV